MLNELVTPENASTEMLRDIYDAALMEVTIDPDGDSVILSDDVVARAKLTDGNERLQLSVHFALEQDAQRIDRLELANRINDQFVLARASIGEDDNLCLDFAIVLKGGVSKRHIAYATRNFLSVVPRAVSDCDEETIVE